MWIKLNFHALVLAERSQLQAFSILCFGSSLSSRSSIQVTTQRLNSDLALSFPALSELLDQPHFYSRTLLRFHAWISSVFLSFISESSPSLLRWKKGRRKRDFLRGLFLAGKKRKLLAKKKCFALKCFAHDNMAKFVSILGPQNPSIDFNEVQRRWSTSFGACECLVGKLT